MESLLNNQKWECERHHRKRWQFVVDGQNFAFLVLQPFFCPSSSANLLSKHWNLNRKDFLRIWNSLQLLSSSFDNAFIFPNNVVVYFKRCTRRRQMTQERIRILEWFIKNKKRCLLKKPNILYCINIVQFLCHSCMHLPPHFVTHKSWVKMCEQQFWRRKK